MYAASLRAAPRCSAPIHAAAPRSSPLRAAPRCCASLRSALPLRGAAQRSHRSALLRLAPLRSGAAHRSRRSALLHFALLRCAASRGYNAVPGEIQDYNVKGVGEGPRLFPSLINNIIMPRDGLASSGWISMAYAVRGRGREAGR